MLYCTAYRDRCQREPAESNRGSAGIREDSDRTKRLGNDYRYRRYRGYERIPGLYTYFRHVPV